MAKSKKSVKQEVTLFWFLVFCIGAPLLVVYIVQLKGGMSAEDARLARYAGIFVTVTLNLLLIAKGEYKLVLKHSKDYDPRKVAEEAIKKQKESIAPIRNDGDGSPPYRIIKDPASGAETLYEWNEKTGQWESQDGLSILNEEGLDDWYKQRQKDREWQDRENEKIRKGDTAFDRELKRMKEEADREQARMEAESKEMWEHYKRYGTWETDPEKLKEILRNRQELAAIEGRRAAREGNLYAAVEFGLTLLSKVCDYSIDVLGELTGPAGKYGIKSVYITGRNFGYRWTEAVNDGRDMSDAMRQATGDTIVDLVQAHAPKQYRYVANSGGDMYKKAMENMREGKDVTDGLLEAGLGGAARTKVGNMIEGKFNAQSTLLKKTSAQHNNKLLDHFTKGDISQKTLNALRSNNRAATLQNMKQLNGKQSLATNISNDIINKLFNG